MSEPTARELEVLAAFIRHRSRKQAAAALGISDATAAWYLKRLYRKRPDLRPPNPPKISTEYPPKKARQRLVVRINGSYPREP
jgi:hypothetical protein